MMSDAELLAVGLLDAQRDGDEQAMRLMVDHASAEGRAAMVDLLFAEMADRTLAETERVTTLLGRASVYSRLDQLDPLRRHQVAHPFQPVVDALWWELGDRTAGTLLHSDRR